MTARVVIVGATSAIAEACARSWARGGARLYLLARNAGKLDLVAADLRTRGATVDVAPFDAADFAGHAAALERAFATLGTPDIVLIAHGDLPDQMACETDVQRALAALTTNATSVVSLATIAANALLAQGRGTLVAIGSVAGDRGRASNYVYGAAKALVGTFLEGLAGRSQGRGVCIINIKPGFVDTPMTAAFPKGALWAKPDDIAAIVCRRAAAGVSGAYYAPRFWWLVMFVIRHLPAAVLYRLKL